MSLENDYNQEHHMKIRLFQVALITVLFSSHVYSFYRVENHTVASIVSEISQGNITAYELVDGYLTRIKKIENSDKRLNAIISINPYSI